MGNIVSSILTAIVTAFFSILGTLYVQKRKNESVIKKKALILYLNLKQTKSDIDKDKKVIDNSSENEISPMVYFNPINYIEVLSELKNRLSEQEIIDVNNFYENVKKLDGSKMCYFNFRNLDANNPSMNPAFPGAYWNQYRNSYSVFQHDINMITNSEEYKTNLVNIISKLKKIKD